MLFIPGAPFTLLCEVDFSAIGIEAHDLAIEPLAYAHGAFAVISHALRPHTHCRGSPWRRAVHVWSQVVSGDLAVDRFLDGEAVFRGDDAASAVYPVPNVLLLNSGVAPLPQAVGEFGLCLADCNDTIQCVFHAVNDTQQQLTMSTPVEFLGSLQHVLYRLHMGIGRRIKARLSEMRQTQAWLAKQTSTKERTLTDANLSAMIKRDSVRSEFTGQIAEALGVNVRWLIYGKGQKLRDLVPAAAREPSMFSPEADKLAELFDGLAVNDRRTIWPWLIRLLSPGPPMPEAFLPFPDYDRRTRPDRH